MNKLKLFAPAILRIGLALVFLWFGLNQIIKPADWVGYIPDWVANLSPFSVTTLVYLNGAFEIIFGTALFLGFFTRIAALLLFLHIADITLTVGLDAVGVRDFGLTVATLVIFLNGADFFTLDRFVKEESTSSDVA